MKKWLYITLMTFLYIWDFLCLIVIISVSFAKDELRLRYAYNLRYDPDKMVNITTIFMLVLLLIALCVQLWIFNVRKRTKAKEQRIEQEYTKTERLEKLKELFDKGILTQEEFDAEKRKLLNF